MSTNRIIKKYWIMGYPYFESRIFFIPNDIGKDYESLVKMKLYDQDGALINEIKMIVSSRSPLILDLENFMGDCKPESGIKYGSLLCEMDEFIGSYLRFQTKRVGVYVKELMDFNSKMPVFLPVNFSQTQSNVLMLLNEGNEEVQIEYRIIKGNRAPSRVLDLGQMNSRIIFLNEVFKDLINDFNDKNLDAYLKLTVLKGNLEVGAQIITYNSQAQEGDFFSIS